ncbi:MULTISPECIES: hypothetical protein [Flavobacteriaceae]|uniref:hypothetical protein n=1 Tax=Flavobacteriaceae TaxID=49546 RepID=UPI001491D682|nr:MULTISPECIES: hypothetical protein [Allomuricauda]MDC6367135.1 hypothetical protein [Muricauda sp. AC10]
MKNIVIVAILVICVISCKQEKKKVDKVQLVESYIDALNGRNFDEVFRCFKDSIRMKELDYASAYSKREYYPFFQWDSTFGATYQILEIKPKGMDVEMKVSKQCTRIQFLNEEPIITKELVKFEDGAINSVDITEYIVFNDEKWTGNRERLVTWIKTNYPELDGFLIDQSRQGALNYLKAIELYQKEGKN